MKSFDDLTKISVPGNPGYVDLASTASTMDYWKNYLLLIQKGQVPDSVATNYDNSYVSNAYFNTNTDETGSPSKQKLASCNYSKDKWVFDKANCSTYPTKAASDPNKFNLGFIFIFLIFQEYSLIFFILFFHKMNIKFITKLNKF